VLCVTYAECRKLGHYAECLYAECRYAECRGTEEGATSISTISIRPIDKNAGQVHRCVLGYELDNGNDLAYFHR